jgi:hypothetical protein
MLADCLRDLAALGPGGLPAVAGALFLAGLVGGATHCAGMCAPFVLAQAGAAAARGGGTLARLSGAALLPYHLGRMIGYAGLGAVAGGAAGLVTALSGLRIPLAGLLALAAVLMLAQASARLPPRWRGRLPHLPLPSFGPVMRVVGPLLARPEGVRGVALGLALSALPCGLLYAALAGAAATGSALGGAIAMAAFVLGTVPALVGVAALGRLFVRRTGPALQPLAAGLFLLNGLVLGAMAWRLVA